MTLLAYGSMFVVTWSLRDRHVVIWTNQRPADVQQLSPCVSVKFIHVESRERKMSMPPDLMTGCRDAKTEPIAAQLAILPTLYIIYDRKVA